MAKAYKNIKQDINGANRGGQIVTKQGSSPQNTVTPPQNVDNVKPAKALRPLTNKQKLFVKYLLDNPKASATAAAKASYNVTTQRSAETMAYENMSKPVILSQLSRNSDVFESVVTNTAKQWGNSDNTRQRELALQASYWGHDKVHGKATQRVESTTTGVTLSIDLTGVMPVADDTTDKNTTPKQQG